MKRFLDKVDKTKTCWLWLGGKDRDGYGRFHLNGKNRQAHRASYMLHVGNIPDGKLILHHCDNPSCVNPMHLYAGTAADNNMDMMNRGRHNYKAPRGEINGRCKLSDKTVKLIRKLHKTGEYTQAYLAETFGVGAPHLSNIVRGIKR